MNRVLGIWALGALLLTGCGGGQSSEPVSRMTEAQRDTAISRSDLPGAAAVGRAFDAAEQGAGHAAQVDSLPR